MGQCLRICGSSAGEGLLLVSEDFLVATMDGV